MAENRIVKRPYRSKRNRPCDLCRSRKVLCHIESGLPCSLCAKCNMNCTFITGPVKKHQQQSVVLETTPTFSSEDDENMSRQRGSLGLDGGLPFASMMGLPRQQAGALGDDADGLQRSPERPYFDGQLDSNHIFDFNMPEFDSPSFHDAVNAHHSAIIGQGSPDLHDNITTQPHHAISPARSIRTAVNPIDRQDGVHGVYFGLSGDTDPYLLRHLPYNERGEFKMFKLIYRQLGDSPRGRMTSSQSPGLGVMQEDSYSAPATPAYFMMAADELGDCGKEDTTVRKDVSPETIRTELDCLILPEDGRRLFGLFYKYVFPALPVISRSQLGIGSSSSSLLPSPETISKVPTHLLAAVYAASLPFWHYDDHLCVMKAYKRPSASKIWRIAYEEILRDIHTPRLSVLQACLLYLQKQRAPQDSAAADTPFRWSFMAWTVGLATSLGLHVDCAKWEIPAWEKRLRRRLWWVVYTEEKWRSLLVGQPTLIRKDQWDVGGLKDEDFFVDAEDCQSDRLVDQNVEGGLHSRYLAALAQIVDDVYESLFTLKASRIMSDDFYLSSKTIKPLQERLQAWHSSLPNSLRVQSASAPNLDSNVSLNLAYITLDILLRRALLRAVPQSGYFKNTSRLSTDRILHAPNTAELQNAIELAIMDAVNSAKVAIEFTGDMTSRDFSGFWHSWSRICFSTISNFVMLLMVKAPTREYATTAKSLADQWRQTLRFQSRSCEQMKMGMLRLDAIYWTGIDNLFADEQKTM